MITIPSWVWIIVAVEVIFFAIFIPVVVKITKKKYATNKAQINSSPTERQPIQQKNNVQPQTNVQKQQQANAQKQQQANVQKQTTPATAQQPAKAVEAQPSKNNTVATQSKETTTVDAKTSPDTTVATAKQTPSMKTAVQTLNKVEQPKPEETTPVQQQPAVETQPVASQEQAPAQDSTYHISKRFVDDKWIITLNNNKKPMRVFDTQAEAVAFATEMATKKNGNVIVHKRSAK